MTPILLATLAAGAALQSSRAASAPAPPEPYPLYAWRSGGPAADARWAGALRALGFTGTNLQGSESPGVATELGLGFYADSVAPRAAFHRDPDDPAWRAARDAFESTRSKDSLRRVPCLDDPAVIAEIRATAAERARSAASAGARFLSVADEPSFTVGTSPLDFDLSPPSIAAFRRRLVERFGTPEALARAWSAPRAPFDTIEPWTTDAIRAREWDHAPPWNFAPWSAAREHADATFADALASAVVAARAAAPGVPVGFLGTQPPSAFGGYDWGRLLAARPDVLEVYEPCGARDLVRALAPGVELVDTVFADPPELAPARMSWAFARGGRSTIVWANDALFERGDASRPTPYARAVGERARALRALAPAVSGAARESDSVALVVSAPSVRAGWLFDARRDGASWPRRLTSYEYERSTQLASLESWLALLDDLGIAPSAIDARALPRAGAPLPRVVILPRCVALSPAEVEALRRHVVGGGTLLAEGRPALFDDAIVGGGPAAALDPLFELAPCAFNGFADENAQPGAGSVRSKDGLVVLESRLAQIDGAPARVVQAAGGRAVLMNLSTIEYRDDRLIPGNARARALRAIVEPVVAAGVSTPRVRVTTTSSLPIAATRERRGDDLFVLVSANVRRKPELALSAPPSIDAALEIAGAKPTSVARLDGGERELAPDAAGRFAFALDPRHLALLRVRW